MNLIKKNKLIERLVEYAANQKFLTGGADDDIRNYFEKYRCHKIKEKTFIEASKKAHREVIENIFKQVL